LAQTGLVYHVGLIFLTSRAAELSFEVADAVIVFPAVAGVLGKQDGPRENAKLKS
jgi:hypothetical protein